MVYVHAPNRVLLLSRLAPTTSKPALPASPSFLTRLSIPRTAAALDPVAHAGVVSPARRPVAPSMQRLAAVGVHFDASNWWNQVWPCGRSPVVRVRAYSRVTSPSILFGGLGCIWHSGEFRESVLRPPALLLGGSQRLVLVAQHALVVTQYVVLVPERHRQLFSGPLGPQQQPRLRAVCEVILSRPKSATGLAFPRAGRPDQQTKWRPTLNSVGVTSLRG